MLALMNPLLVDGGGARVKCGIQCVACDIVGLNFDEVQLASGLESDIVTRLLEFFILGFRLSVLNFLRIVST
eukprot:1391734-Amorphochlora_amoeboformis.AAC.2